MEHIDEVRSQLRMKKQEYQTLRDDYEILRQNIKDNVDSKKVMRKEIEILTKEFQSLKAQTKPEEPQPELVPLPETEDTPDIDTGTESLL